MNDNGGREMFGIGESKGLMNKDKIRMKDINERE